MNDLCLEVIERRAKVALPVARDNGNHALAFAELLGNLQCGVNGCTGRNSAKNAFFFATRREVSKASSFST